MEYILFSIIFILASCCVYWMKFELQLRIENDCYLGFFKLVPNLAHNFMLNV